MKDSFDLPAQGPAPIVKVPTELPDTDSFAGEYLSPAYGTVVVESKGKELLIKYQNQSWTGTSQDDGRYAFVMEIFGGMKIPMSITFVEDGLVIPFNLDPETPPIKFIKASH